MTDTKNTRGLKGHLDKTSHAWQLKSTRLKFGRLPAVMGIVNVTPDSFSDGGKFLDPELAVEQGLKLAGEGADILDIGGESTRPYSVPVAADEEARRVCEVIRSLAKQTDVPISIDTSKASVAAAAIDAGAEIINDVTGLAGDPEMIRVAVESKAGVCAMHMQGTPQTMQDDPVYDDVVADIYEYLLQRKTFLLEAGVELERICLDPGIGFGKTHNDNLELIAKVHRFHLLGCPILVGHSRKGFIGHILEDKTADRDSGTLAITLMLAQKKIQIIRVHEVQETIRAIQVFEAAGGTSV